MNSYTITFDDENYKPYIINYYPNDKLVRKFELNVEEHTLHFINIRIASGNTKFVSATKEVYDAW